MIFNSLPFIFLFLPLVLVGRYLILGRRSESLKISFLVVASLIFYANWNYKYLALIIGSSLFNFLLGNYLCEHKKKGALVFGISLNLSLLGYFKYYYFIVQNLGFLGFPEEFMFKPLLPLAISFFTFQQIAYLVDEFKTKGIKYSFKEYLLFVCFFPQLIAGPIVQHRQLIPQFTKLTSFHEEKFVRGIIVFVFGLAKKVLIADHFSLYVGKSFAVVGQGSLLNAADAFIGIMSYTFQIYFDFSGYSDMAIGLAFMFGISLPLNFDSPYKSLNISDFWRRWHMTLSAFLRDYLYIPLGGNRKGPLRKNINLMLTMVLGGFWHGAGWNFLIWGGLHGLYLIICHNYKKVVNIELPRVLSLLLTFFAVVFAWIFFRAETFQESFLFLKSFTNWDLSSSVFRKYWPILMKLLICFVFCVKSPHLQELIGIGHKERKLNPWYKKYIDPKQIQMQHALYLIILIFVILNAITRETSEFLYYQF